MKPVLSQPRLFHINPNSVTEDLVGQAAQEKWEEKLSSLKKIFLFLFCLKKNKSDGLYLVQR